MSDTPSTLTAILAASMVNGRKIVTTVTDGPTLWNLLEKDSRAGIKAAVESRLRALGLPATRPAPVKAAKPKAPRPSRAKEGSTVKPKPPRVPGALKGTVYPHVCPCGCGRTATDEAEAEVLFGFRNMKRYIKGKGEEVVERRIQSFSKKCRNVAAKSATTNPTTK